MHPVQFSGPGAGRLESLTLRLGPSSSGSRPALTSQVHNADDPFWMPHLTSKTVAENLLGGSLLSPLMQKRAACTALGPGKWGQEAGEGSWGRGCLEQNQPNETVVNVKVA